MKPKRKAGLLGAVALLLVLPASCSKSNRANTKEPPVKGKPSDPAVQLKAQWQPGQRYVFRMEQTRGSEVRRANQPRPLLREDRVAQEVAVTVTNAPGQNLGFEFELLKLELEITQGERTLVQYASQNEFVTVTGNPSADSLEKLIGGRLYYLLSPENKVLRVEGMKEFMERAEGSAAAADPGRPRRTTNVRSYYNPDSMRAILDLSGLPENPVRVGDSWPVQRSFPAGSGGASVVNATYTFKGWQEHDRKKCARIDISGLSAPKTTNALARAAASPPMKDSKVSGQCWFDVALGFPIETVLEQSYTVTTVAPQPRPGTDAPAQNKPGTNAAPQTISSPARQYFSIKLTEVAPQ